MTSTNQKLKSLFQAEKFEDCANLAINALMSNENDKVALLFLAQSQCRLLAIQECQDTLNRLYSQLQVGQKQDDTMLLHAYKCQDTLAIKMQSQPTQQMKKTGREIQIKNKFQIVDYYDRKQMYKEMVSESEMYCLLLMEDSRLKEVEETYQWLFDHKGLTKSQRVQFGARIFDIDTHYNTQQSVEHIFPLLVEMCDTCEDQQENEKLLTMVACKFIDNIEMKQGKKSIQAALQSQNEQVISRFFEFCAQIKLIGKYAFLSKDIIFKNKAYMRHYCRYITTYILSTMFLSAEWQSLLETIQSVLNTQFMRDSEFDFDGNPLQFYLNAVLEVTHWVKQARQPSFNELWVAKVPDLSVEKLDLFVKEYQEYSMFANLYYAIIATSKECPLKFNVNAVDRGINQSLFLFRKQGHYKLPNQNANCNLVVYACSMQMRLQLDDLEQYNKNISYCESSVEKYQQQCDQELVKLFQMVTVDIRWRQHLQNGKWHQAIKGLEELIEINPEKANMALIKKSQIQIQNIEELCGDSPDDKALVIQGVFNAVQGCKEIDAENLLLQGYLMWTYPDIFKQDKKQILNKWLQALKKDQTNPEIYFCLAVYYFLQKDNERASKCLDRVLKLEPNFEQAFLLQFYLTSSLEARISLIDRFMEINKNVAVTYFFKGLIMQQKQDFIQAIEYFQNAIKFYTIQKGKQATANRLVPKIELAIHENPFGIYGEANAAICWVYLSECFMKIEKLNVALKCFTQSIEEIAKVQQYARPEVSNEMNFVIEILNYDRFAPNQLQMQTDPILVALSALVPSKWVLECLMIGCRLVPDARTAIALLKVALQCSPNANMLAYILGELLGRLTTLVDQGVVFENGQVQLFPDAIKVFQRVDQLLTLTNSEAYLECQNLQKKRLNAMFAIAQRTKSVDRFKQAMDLASQLFESRRYPGWISLILDYAKIIHEYQRFDDSDPQLQARKVELIRQAIVAEPAQANLWVHLHLFSRDEFVRARAIFKAYELEPESTFVQELTLKFFIQTKQWQKAFKIIVRSYQRAIDANEPQQPVVLATLAYFNAVSYFETGKKVQLLEALSLIRLVQREDMQQLLSELYVYLSHYNGDYIQTLNFLQSRPKSDEIDALLLKANFGLSTYTYAQCKAQAEKLGLAKDLLASVFNVEMATDDDVQAHCEEYIQKFEGSPSEVAPFLALYQEVCLKRKILPAINLLDNANVKEKLKSLEPSNSRTITIQALRLLFLRDGTIKESKQILEGGHPQDESQPDEQNYTEFIIHAAGLKPQNLSTAQHKALLRAYFAAKRDPSTLEGPFGGQEIKKQDQARNQGLRQILKQQSDKNDNGLAIMMRNPLSIDANTQWLWSLVRSGKVQEAFNAFEMVKKRIEAGFMQGSSTQFDIFEKFLNSITTEQEDKKVKASRISLIASLCRNLKGFAAPSGQENTRKIACSIATTLCQVQIQSQAQMVRIIFQTLQIVLLEQGHYLQFNKLAKEIMNFVTVSGAKQHVKNLVWHYQLLTTASSLLQMKKMTQVTPLCKEIEQVARRGSLKRSLIPVTLMKARTYLQADNLQQLQTTLNIDDPSIERDFMIAVSQYAAQDYKQYYLVCLGLVAGAKASTDQNGWNLAYAYYLKAFAEMTFLMAKRKGIKLQDDFSEAEGSFDLKFFTRKASTSLNKCLINLQQVGEIDGVLAQAAHQMLKQI